MLRDYLAYRRAYRELKFKDVRELAMDSARQFWQGDTRIPNTIDNFQAYQRGFIHAYRASYAKAKVDDLKKFYN